MPDRKKIGLGSSLFSIAKKAGSKTVKLARIAKLNTEINAAKEEIRKAQLEIGKTYYETFRDEPHPPLTDCCVRIKRALDLIHEKRQLIEEIKTGHKENEDDDLFS